MLATSRHLRTPRVSDDSVNTHKRCGFNHGFKLARVLDVATIHRRNGTPKGGLGSSSELGPGFFGGWLLSGSVRLTPYVLLKPKGEPVFARHVWGKSSCPHLGGPSFLEQAGSPFWVEGKPKGKPVSAMFGGSIDYWGLWFCLPRCYVKFFFSHQPFL